MAIVWLLNQFHVLASDQANGFNGQSPFAHRADRFGVSAFGLDSDARLHADLMNPNRDIDVHEAERRRIQRFKLQLGLGSRGVGYLELLLALAVSDLSRFHF